MCDYSYAFIILNSEQTAYITSDKIKFATLAKCLDGQLLQQIEGIMTDPRATGRYAKLKAELIRILTVSARVKKLVKTEEMGDGKPSQFYQHLTKLANPSTSHDIILTMWRNQLPACYHSAAQTQKN